MTKNKYNNNIEKFNMNILIGIGNELLGDDGIGPYIVKRFKHKRWKTINTETVPENFVSVIIKNKPEILVIIDAADMGLEHGEFRVIKKEKIDDVSISTHNISIHFLINYLEEFASNIIFIGVQPEKIQYGSKISKPLKKSAKEIIEILKTENFEKIKFFNDNNL